MRARAIGILMSLLAATAALAEEPAAEPTTSAAPSGRGPTEGVAPKRPWLGEACKQDFATNCSSLPASSKRDEIVQCLKSHEAVLSEECRSALAERPPGYGRFAGRGGGPEMGGIGRGRHGGGMGGGGGYSSGNETNPASTIPPSADSDDTKRMLGDR